MRAFGWLVTIVLLAISAFCWLAFMQDDELTIAAFGGGLFWVVGLFMGLRLLLKGKPIEQK